MNAMDVTCYVPYLRSLNGIYADRGVERPQTCCAVWREALRQHTPLAACLHQIHDGIKDAAEHGFFI